MKTTAYDGPSVRAREVRWGTLHVNGDDDIRLHWYGGGSTETLRNGAFLHFEDLCPELRWGLPTRTRILTSLCHKNMLRFVLRSEEGGEMATSHTFADTIERDIAKPVLGFRHAHNLHRHLLKHVLGFEEFVAGVPTRTALHRAEKGSARYLQLLGEHAPPNQTLDWQDFVDRLQSARCPAYAQLLRGMPFEHVETTSPCRSLNQLCACHAALLPLAEAYQEWLSRCLEQALDATCEKAGHAHVFDSTEKQEEIIAWTRNRALIPLVESADGFVIKSGFLLGNEEDTPDAATSRLRRHLGQKLTGIGKKSPAIHFPGSVRCE